MSKFELEHYSNMVTAEKEAAFAITHYSEKKIGNYIYNNLGERFLNKQTAEYKRKLISYREKYIAVIEIQNTTPPSYKIYVRRKTE